MEAKKAHRKQLVGRVHSLYKKAVKRSKRVKSHDAKNECSIGDIVRIEETRPLSRDKRYRLIEIVEKVK